MGCMGSLWAVVRQMRARSREGVWGVWVLYGPLCAKCEPGCCSDVCKVKAGTRGTEAGAQAGGRQALSQICFESVAFLILAYDHSKAGGSQKMALHAMIAHLSGDPEPADPEPPGVADPELNRLQLRSGIEIVSQRDEEASVDSGASNCCASKHRPPALSSINFKENKPHALMRHSNQIVM